MSLLPDSTPSTKSVLWGIAGEAIKRKTTNTTPAVNKSNLITSENVGILAFILVLFTFASCPMKILVRKNFGPKAISLIEIIFGALFFAISAAYMEMYVQHETSVLMANADKLAEYGIDVYKTSFRQEIFLLSPKILLAMAGFVLAKGLWEYFKAQRIESDDWVDENYRGDSLFFKKIPTSLKMQCRRWRNTEPTLCFTISLLLFPLIGFAALAFFIASLAFKANEYYQVKYKWEKLLPENNKPATPQSNTGYVAN